MLLFFGQVPEFTVILEYTCHIVIESFQLDPDAVVSAIEDIFECSKGIYAEYSILVDVFFSVNEACQQFAGFPFINPVSCDVTIFSFCVVYQQIAFFYDSWCRFLNVFYLVFDNGYPCDVVCIFWADIKIGILRCLKIPMIKAFHLQYWLSSTCIVVVCVRCCEINGFCKEIDEEYSTNAVSLSNTYFSFNFLIYVLLTLTFCFTPF